MKKAKISASMMCAGLDNLRQTLEILEKEKVDYLHIDVMDGSFVPNFGLGSDYIRELRNLTYIPLDIHFMVSMPENKYPFIEIRDTDVVSVHYESTTQIQRALDQLSRYGCRRFIAINPATPVCALEEVLDSIDGINLLMVNPGFSGQKIVPSTKKKAQKLKRFLEENKKENIEVEVDGNITFENARILSQAGASMFVAGTSSLFRGSVDDYSQNIELLKKSTSGRNLDGLSAD